MCTCFSLEDAGEGEGQREDVRRETLGIEMFGMLHRLGGWIWEGEIYHVFVLWFVYVWLSENLTSNSHGFSVMLFRVSLLVSGYLCVVRSGVTLGDSMNRPSSSNNRNSIMMTSWNGNFFRFTGRSPVNSPHKGPWRGAFMFSLICVWINGWVNNREAGDLGRHRPNYDVTVMQRMCIVCIII